MWQHTEETVAQSFFLEPSFPDNCYYQESVYGIFSPEPLSFVDDFAAFHVVLQAGPTRCPA